MRHRVANAGLIYPVTLIKTQSIIQHVLFPKELPCDSNFKMWI